jgi:hypothetical protein
MKATLSRREFLKFSRASLAAGLLPGCRSKPSPPTPTFNLPKETPTPTRVVTPTSLPKTPVTLPGTETWNITSKIVGQEYQIFINFPGSYDAAKRFPVLYTTDGNGLFPLVRAIYGELRNEQKIPEMIIIGIGYPTPDAALISDLRALDLTPYAYAPTYDGSSQPIFPRGTGRGLEFYRFIRDELKPAIDDRYFTLPEETTLVGHSLGGLFTLYAMFQDPGIFKRYVAGSPSIWWANASILATEKAFAVTHTDLAAYLYMGAGSEEGSMVSDVNTMNEALQKRGYPGLQMTTEIFDGESHLSVIPFCISRGLRAVNR